MLDDLNWPTWPIYGDEEAEAVERVIRSNQLFADREVRTFEEMYAQYIGSEYVLGVGNATQGLHLSLAALGVGVGDEVIVTPFSFIASASCVLMQNAVPIFADIESESLGLCPIDVEAKITSRTKAIIVVHMFGYPAEIEALNNLAKKYNIALIEDASHSHGAKKNGESIGTFGDIGVFSLHQRKVLSVGDGGVICIKRKDVFEKIFRLRSFGHTDLSYNYRMTEFAGALGQVQLNKLDEQNEIRRKNYEVIKSQLEDNKFIKVRSCRENEYGVYYAVELEVLNNDFNWIKTRLQKLQDHGITIRETFVQPGLNHHAHFNPAEEPPRGLPWLHPNYNGSMKELKYKDLKFPVAENFCSPRLLEFYVHPPVDFDLVSKATGMINQLFK